MNVPAVRSRLLQLRRELEAARSGRDLLDRKREAIVRALAQHAPRRDDWYRVAAKVLGLARTALHEAQTELGRTVIDAAALAQPPLDGIQVHEKSIVGVRVPRVEGAFGHYRAHYGPATASDPLDRAGEAFVATLPSLLALASEETAVRRLRAALARTARRLNAIDQIVLPEISRHIHTVAAALDEEERDEAVRRKCWLQINKVSS